MGRIWPRVAVLLCAALLSACTYSEALRQDEFWPLRSGTAGTAPPSVFYATDRAAEGETFGLHWGASLNCGQMSLNLGTAHGYGLVDHAEPATACDTEAAMAAFATRLQAAARTMNCDRLLLVVHGYNAVFRNAVLRSGQLAADMQWRCPTLLFSWSSEGYFNRYAADIERSSYAVPPLMMVLRALARAGVKPDIMAHSMGARISLSALGQMCVRQAEPLAGEIILAAPDVNAEHGNDDFGRFLTQIAPCVTRTTVYASDNDLALRGSQRIHGGIPRAGEKPSVALQYARSGPDGRVDIVDASLAPGDLAGHGYFSLAYETADDMAGVLAGRTAAQRLRKGGQGTLECADEPRCAAGRYELHVAPERRPDFGTRLLRALYRLILPLQ
jgi:esterase/lipase superfamily enzyme